MYYAKYWANEMRFHDFGLVTYIIVSYCIRVI